MTRTSATGNGIRAAAAAFAIGLSLAAPGTTALADTTAPSPADTTTPSPADTTTPSPADTTAPSPADTTAPSPAGQRNAHSRTSTETTSRPRPESTDTAPGRSAPRTATPAGSAAQRTRTATTLPNTGPPTANRRALPRLTRTDANQIASVTEVAGPVFGSVVPEQSAAPAGPVATFAAAVPATAPAALAVAALPTAAATATAEWFTGLLAPIQAFVEGVGLLIRRTFFNQAPTVAPVQTTGQLGGPITGSLGAADPEGDPLTYAVTVAPRYGSVEIGPDGAYLYTPGTDFTGLDSFNVVVTDTGSHVNLLDPGRPAGTEAFMQLAQNATLPSLTFSFVYGRGAQYWSADARRALEDAALLLTSYLEVETPVTLVFDVTGESAPSSGTLASAGSDLTAGGAGFFATVVARKIQSGVDANGSAADGQISWNFGNPWAFGASVATTEYDFTSTAIHELLHTFGFLSFTVEPGSNTGRTWTTFDQFMVAADGTAVIADSLRWRSGYDANLTGGGGGLYFAGPHAVAAYGGLVPLYTPDPWESGSSTSHLDDNTFTGTNALLMNAATEAGPGVRALSPVELAILRDLGYTLTEPAPLQAFPLLGLGLLRRRPQRPVSWSIRL